MPSSSSAPSSSSSSRIPSAPPLPTVSARFTIFFDGQFWVGVLEHSSGADGGGTAGGAADGSAVRTVRASRHVFGAEPSDMEVHAFLLAHGGDLIDSVECSTPVTAAGRTGGAGPVGPAVNPKRAARQAAKEAARSRPSTAAQAALAASRQEQSARAKQERGRRRRRQADEAWARRRERAKRRHRGR